jgi:putative ABC transport system permease protein
MLPPVVRGLLRQRSFAVAAIATLAVGIAASTALFSTVNAALLRPLPYPRADDLYTVRTYFPSGRFTIGLVASEEMTALAQLSDAVAGVAEARRADAALVTDAGARQLVAYGVSGGFFGVFGVPIAMGRAIEPADAVRGAPRVVVLSHALWTTAYGGRHDVIGTIVRFSAGPARVVGVAPAGFEVPAGSDAWLNMWVPENVGHTYDGFIRLRPGVSLASLQTRMTQAMAVLGRKYPDQDDGRAYALRPLLDATVGDLGPILVILFGATALLVVLAAANVINLTLARSTGRAREIAVRAALGASRTRLLSQLIAESVLLSACGGIAGVALAYAGVRLLLRLGGTRLPRLDALTFDARVAVFAAALVLVIGVVVGVVPALRLAGGDVAATINEGGRSVRGSRRTRRLLAVFVVAEIAVAVALVAGAARLVKSYQQLTAIDPGFDSRGRLVLDLLLPPEYLNQARFTAWWRAVEDRLRAAGAAHVASSSSVPLQHEWDSTAFVDLVSRPDIPPDKRPNARMRTVSEDFFPTMGVRILAGRAFQASDGDAAPAVAIVNEAFARRSLSDLDPLRERIKGIKFRQVDGRPVEELVSIVGIASNVKYSALTADPEPVVYLPSSQSVLPRVSVVLTTPDGRPDVRTAEFRAALREVDPKVPVDVHLMSAIVAASLERQRLGMWLLSGFGLAALLLALVGIFGVIAYVVSQRQGELALRQTLGATRAQVFWMVIRDGGRLTAAGLVTGWIIAWWTGRLVARYVYGARSGDLVVLAGSAAIVALVALAATVGPARRASTPEFARALRQD